MQSILLIPIVLLMSIVLPEPKPTLPAPVAEVSTSTLQTSATTNTPPVLVDGMHYARSSRTLMNNANAYSETMMQTDYGCSSSSPQSDSNLSSNTMGCAGYRSQRTRMKSRTRLVQRPRPVRRFMARRSHRKANRATAMGFCAD